MFHLFLFVITKLCPFFLLHNFPQKNKKNQHKHGKKRHQSNGLLPSLFRNEMRRPSLLRSHRPRLMAPKPQGPAALWRPGWVSASVVVGVVVGGEGITTKTEGGKQLGVKTLCIYIFHHFFQPKKIALSMEYIILLESYPIFRETFLVGKDCEKTMGMIWKVWESLWKGSFAKLKPGKKNWPCLKSLLQPWCQINKGDKDENARSL